MSFEQIIGPILQLIDTIFIYINSLVYDFISFLYQIFIAIADARIFTSEQVQTISSRVYIVIGVVSLFFISYALLNAIMDPDGSSKSEYSVKKIIPNVIKVILLIGFVPVLFSMAYKVQEIVVSTDVISNVILGEKSGLSAIDKETGESSYKIEGRHIANQIWNGFMYPKDNVDAQDIQINECYFASPNCDGISNSNGLEQTANILGSIGNAAAIASNPLAGVAMYIGRVVGSKVDKIVDTEDTERSYTFADAMVEVHSGAKNFPVYANFGSKMHGEDKQLEYNPIFQLIAGIIVIYVLVNFCIDIGVRAIKLGYYQIIAPFPILLLLMPGQKKVFDKWLKSTVSTYIDIFFRIAFFSLAILAIRFLPTLDDTLWANSIFAENKVVQNFARVFLIIGILIFMKQAPKLLSDLLGTEGFKLGIKDKLSEMAGIGGAVKKGLERAEGAAIGGTTGALGGAYSAWRNKGDVRKGLKTGFWTGFKGSGNQFGRQMQNIYSQGGGKGVAGAFGGQKWSDRMSDRYKDQYKDDYQDRILSARVNAKTDFTDPKQRIAQFYQDQKKYLSEQKQREIDKYSDETVAAKDKMNIAKVNFEKNKQAKLDAVKSQAQKLGITGVDGEVDQLSAANAVNLIQGYENYEKGKQAKLASLKTDMDNMQSEQSSIISNAKAKYNQDVAKEISRIQTDMSQAQIKFDSDKRARLESLNKQLSEQYQLGNSAAVQKIQSDISLEQARKFDPTEYTIKIADLKNKKFEDSDLYRVGKAEFDTRIQKKQQEYDDVAKMTYETDETSDYKIHYAKANKDAQQLFAQYQSAYNTKVEDDEEYKTAKAIYDSRNDAYNKANSALNENTEVIIRNVYDAKKKKLVEMVFNPYHKGEDDKYIDPSDEEAVKEARVTAVEKQSFDNAIKDLKDKDETFKNEDTVFAQRIKDKDDADWLKSDEGRHMSMIMGKYFDKKMDKPDSKDDKK